MIRAGRDVVSRLEIAALHGQSEATAHKKKPWAQDGHPAPVTTRKAAQGYPTLWDRQQAEQFAASLEVEPLPEEDRPDDLLDRFEAAAVAGVKPEAWEKRYQNGRLPSDDERCGVPFWNRSTAERERDNPPTRGRPSGTTGGRRQDALDLEQRIRALLDEAAAAGTSLTNLDIARRLEVHVNTVGRHLARIRAESSS
ncbi:hypothetical protein ACVDFE_00080 [Lentzea chajnantorensis]